MMKWLAAAAAVLACAGCASVTQGSTHPLRIETETAKGEVIEDAQCTLTNDQGTTVATSGTSAPVRRSSKDLEIVCSTTGQPDASARLISRANSGMAGNILLGGAIGAIVDHNNGTAYTYPTWVRLVFGEFAVLDRRDEREGTALAAAPGTSSRVVASTATSPAAARSAAGEPTARRVVLAADLARGWILDYRLTDRASNRSTDIMLRIDRIDDQQVTFNSGARIENRRAGAISQGAGQLGELDSVTPPGGWLSGGRVPRGMWPVKFSTVVSGSRMSYDLMASVGGEQTVRTKAGEFRATRVELEGWVERGSSNITTGRARYRGTLWISQELGRPIRFEAKSRAPANVGMAFFEIDEVVELTGVTDGQQ
jgi:hypothetical protein